MGVLINIAARNLAQAKRRTFFLSLALVLVTALLMLLLGLSRGLTDTIMRSATTLSAGHVNIAGFHKTKANDAAPIITKTDELRKIAVENTPGLDFVIDRTRGWARIVTEVSSLNAGLNGVEPAEESRLFETLRPALESEYVDGGRDEAVGDLTALDTTDAAVLFAKQAKRLGVHVGDYVTITVETLTGARNTAEYKIVGIARDIGFMSNWSVFLSKAGVRRLYALDDDVSGAVQIYLKDATKSAEVMDHLRKVYESKGFQIMEHDPNPFWMKFEKVTGEDWVGQKLDLTIWSDEVSFLTWVLTAIDAISFFLIGILMLIIAIGIMNSMWMSVRERTIEVGTLRAIGMSRGRVLIMFMLEALILGVVATSVGALLGAAIAGALDAAKIEIPVDAVRAILMSDTLHLVVAPVQIVGAVVVFTVIAAGSALWPAYRASRLQPVTAIHHIG